MRQRYSIGSKVLLILLFILFVIIVGPNGAERLHACLGLMGLAIMSMIPHVIYYEVSFLRKRDRYYPKIHESIILGLFIGIGFLVWNFQGLHGESGLAFIAVSPFFIILFIVAGLPVAILYMRRNKSLFKK